MDDRQKHEDGQHTGEYSLLPASCFVILRYTARDPGFVTGMPRSQSGHTSGL
jgi:hypothetical protein